jgi:hypothetical protein
MKHDDKSNQRRSAGSFDTNNFQPLQRESDSKLGNADAREHSLFSLICVQQAAEVKKQVSFSTVRVREYALTLGDHPQPDAYPVSLDWRHSDDKILSVDVYRQGSSASPGTLHMTRQERRQRLVAVMGLSAVDVTVQEELRQARQRELDLVACPLFENDHDTDDEILACIVENDDDEGDDDIDSCCSEGSDDSDESDIVLLSDAAPRRQSPIRSSTKDFTVRRHVEFSSTLTGITHGVMTPCLRMSKP